MSSSFIFVSCACLCLCAQGGSPASELDGLSVREATKISADDPIFGGTIADRQFFGAPLVEVGDLDGNGIVDLGVGDVNGSPEGGLWILFREPDGRPSRAQKISATEGGFGGVLHVNDVFGASIAPLGDLDGDGVLDIAVGASGDDDGGVDTGAVWILFLKPDGTVKSHQKISATEGGFFGQLLSFDIFGVVTALGDVDGDSVMDLAVGAPADNVFPGWVYILFLRPDGTVKGHRRIGPGLGDFPPMNPASYLFGVTVSGLGDLDGDCVPDLAIGTTEDGFDITGVVWIVFLRADGTVRSARRIDRNTPELAGQIDTDDIFAIVRGLGDLNADGIPELGVGAVQDDDGGTDRGALWILSLDPDGSIRDTAKISDTRGGFRGALHDEDHFCMPALLEDHDGDGVLDLAVSATGSDEGGLDRGAFWMLRLAQGKALRSAAPSATVSVTLPIRTQCAPDPTRLALRPSRPIPPGAIPVLVVSPDPGGSPSSPYILPNATTRRLLIGNPTTDGLATFVLGDPRETALRCRGFYLTPSTSHLVPGVVMRQPD